MHSSKTDSELQADVFAALHHDPTILAAHIGVSAIDGAITLSGDLESEEERFRAVETVQRVEGVDAVADEINVVGFRTEGITDTDIAIGVAHAFAGLPPESAHVTVDVVDHVVILRGRVARYRERSAAEGAASLVGGVTNVVNQIEIGPSARVEDVKANILEVFLRRTNESVDAIRVELDDGHVALRGNVSSLREKALAEWASYETPGVSKVKNHLHVHS
jgi:osmotically-inducible protein OsmY